MQNDMITVFVKEERKNQNLTQQELAEKSGVSVRSVSSIELGESVRKSTIEKVLETLGFKMIIRYEFKKLKK